MSTGFPGRRRLRIGIALAALALATAAGCGGGGSSGGPVTLNWSIFPEFSGAFVKGGFGPGRVNQVRLDAYRDRSPDELVQTLRAHLRPHGLTAGFGK